MKAEIVNKSLWLNSDDEKKTSFVIESTLKIADFTILGTIEHHFNPVGYTILWLLAESHCAMHTFPEEVKIYIELSSCSIEKFDNFWSLFMKNLHLLELAEFK
jgi:S-adenosylmethionine decarboxylase